MKFAADMTVGKLAQWLRLMGYDSVDIGLFSSESVLALANEDRVFLTKNRHLSKKTEDLKVVCLHSNDPKDQVREISRALRLQPDKNCFFTRCKFCNTILKRATHREIIDYVPDYVWQNHERFSRCDTCGRVYWSGTHSDNMIKTLRDLLSE